MSQALSVLTIQSIKCRNLRSADFLSKNDVYVIFRCGTKKTKTKYISGGGAARRPRPARAERSRPPLAGLAGRAGEGRAGAGRAERSRRGEEPGSCIARERGAA